MEPPEFIDLGYRPVPWSPDQQILYRLRHDCTVRFVDHRALVLPPIHLRPDVDEADTELECWAEGDTELED